MHSLIVFSILQQRQQQTRLADDVDDDAVQR